MIRGINNKPYISLDSYINLDSLLELDDELRTAIPLVSKTTTNYLKTNLLYKNNELHPDFYSDMHYNKIKNIDNNIWFSHNDEIALKKAKKYPHISNHKLCEYTENVEYFPKTAEFVKNLPITEGRIVIFTNSPSFTGIVHRDTNMDSYHRTMFFWFRTNLDKKFFILDPDTLDKHYIEGYAAFFNSHDYHGHDNSNELQWSFRVDGVFTEDFKKKLGIQDLKYW